VFLAELELVALLVAEDHPAAGEHDQDVSLNHHLGLDEDQQHEPYLLDDHEHQDGLHDLLLGGLLQIQDILQDHLDEEAQDAHHRERAEL